MNSLKDFTIGNSAVRLVCRLLTSILISMVLDRIGDFLEGIEPLETVVAEGTCQLATHFGVLSHGDYEMRVAVWRSLSHYGGSRYRVLDNLADDSLSHQPTG